MYSILNIDLIYKKFVKSAITNAYLHKITKQDLKIIEK